MMRPYFALFVMFFRESLAQRSTIIGSLLLWCLRVTVLVGVYSVAFRARGGSLYGMHFSETMWSIGVYFIVLSLGVRHVAKEMSKEIRLGIVETKLNKPFNYLLAMLATQLGRGCPHFLLSGVFIVLVSLFIIGVPHIAITSLWILQSAALLVGGLLLALIFYGLIGLCAVWLEDVDPLYWILDKAVMVLGGAYIPVALFPQGVRFVGEHTPFGAVMFITHIFNPDFSARWLGLFTTQILWFGILLVCIGYAHTKAIHSLSVNGG